VRILSLDREVYEREGFAASPDPYPSFQVVQGEAEEPKAPTTAAPATPVGAEVEAALRRALEKAPLVAEVTRIGRAGDVLVVETKAKPASNEAGVHADALTLARLLLPEFPAWSGLRVVFTRQWRDSFGAVDVRPWIVATITRARFEKLVLENLSPAEVFTHFKVDRPTYEGCVLWDR
jgi:hypothetical protein